MPGNITSRNSFGTNYLIKGAGAKLVQQWQDVAAELPAEIAARLLPPEPSKKKTGTRQQQPTLPADLLESERVVFYLLSADAPAHIDALSEDSKLPISELTEVLLSLEMRELIRQLPGKSFVRKL